MAEVVGRSTPAVRQLAPRARRHVHEARPRYDTSPAEQRRLVEAFARACVEGDLDGLRGSGAAGIVVRDADGRLNVLSFTIAGGRIVAVAAVRNPDKLPKVDVL